MKKLMEPHYPLTMDEQQKLLDEGWFDDSICGCMCGRRSGKNPKKKCTCRGTGRMYVRENRRAGEEYTGCAKCATSEFPGFVRGETSYLYLCECRPSPFADDEPPAPIEVDKKLTNALLLYRRVKKGKA